MAQVPLLLLQMLIWCDIEANGITDSAVRNGHMIQFNDHETISSVKSHICCIYILSWRITIVSHLAMKIFINIHFKTF